MTRQILKQPNGNLAVWSTLVDDFIITDATPEEYIQFRIEEESIRIRKDILEISDKLNRGVGVGYFDVTWNQALTTISEKHGEDRLIYLRSL